MTRHRHSRIIAILVGVKNTLRIVPLTTAINRRFAKAYEPSLIGGDLKVLVEKRLVKVNGAKAFSITDQGKAHFQALPKTEVIALCEALAAA